MVFNPYPYGEPVFVTSNIYGFIYGAAKGAALVMIGVALYDAPSNPPAFYVVISSIALAVLAAAITAGQDEKAEQRYEQMIRLRPNEVNEPLAKANWIALWTCYSLAAHLYGKPTAPPGMPGYEDPRH